MQNKLRTVIVFFMWTSSVCLANPVVKGKVSGIPLNQASIEEIDSENFPDMIKSFDYPNANISDIVKAMSHLTGINFIVDPNIKGKISIIAPSPITVAEAFQAFLSALAINGYALVRSGAFWKVISAESASKDNVELYKGEYFPDADQYITKVFKLKHTNVKNLEVHLKQFLTDKKYKVIFYEKANTIIVSDYGSAIEKISKIIQELDVPDVHNLVEVIPIQYAPALDLATKLQILISRRAGSISKSSGRPGSSLISRGKISSGGISSIIPDERTNSIIVSGTKEGIQKIKSLIRKLDFYISPQISGGIFVYYVKHGKAEEIEKTLNTILNPKSSISKGGGIRSRSYRSGLQSLFGSKNPLSDIRVAHDKNTNSVIVTASKHDYDILKSILEKIDIPKNQVFIKTIIMSLSADDKLNWDVSTYHFLNQPAGSGIVPRVGFSSRNLMDVLNPINSGSSESTFSFGLGNLVTLNLPQNLLNQFLNTGGGGADNSSSSPLSLKLPSLMSLVSLIKNQTGANIISTPQVIAIDNEESFISVGKDIPVSESTTYGAGTSLTSTSIERKEVDTSLKVTPYINPDGQSVRLLIEQKISDITPTTVGSDKIKGAVSITKKQIKTNVILKDEETAVIGGLMSDSETEELTKIPILGDIPIIGWMFRSKNNKKEKSNLIVFITPKIIRTSKDYQNILQDKIDERLNFIKKFMSNKHGSQHSFLPPKISDTNQMPDSTHTPLLSEKEIAPNHQESKEENDSNDHTDQWVDHFDDF